MANKDNYVYQKYSGYEAFLILSNALLNKQLDINSNLNFQIKDYIKNDSLNQSLISDYKNQLVWMSYCYTH